MASRGSFNRKYRNLSPGKFPREEDDDARDVVRGARSMEKLSSLDIEKSPHLIFTTGTGTGSYVKQRQGEFLRSASLSSSQSCLDSLTASHSRTHHHSPTPSGTTASINNNDNDNNNCNSSQAKGDGLRRSSSQRLPRIPSKILRDFELLRIKRHSDIIPRGGGGERKEGGQLDGQGDEPKKSQKLSYSDIQRSSSSSLCSGTPNEGTGLAPRIGVSENGEEVVMRRKTWNNASSPRQQQASEQPVPDRAAKASRPSSLHSVTSSSSSWATNPSVKNARHSLASSRPSSLRPNSGTEDKDSSEQSSTSVERRSSLRELRHSTLFSERYAFWTKSARAPLRSERTVSLTNLSTSTPALDQVNASTYSVLKPNSASSENSPSKVPGHVRSRVSATSASHRLVTSSSLSSFKQTDNSSSPASGLSRSPHSAHSASLSSTPVGRESIMNYDGSNLDVQQSHQDSLEITTAEKTKDRTRTQAAASTKAEVAHDKLSVRNTSRITSFRHERTHQKTYETDQATAAAFTPRVPLQIRNSSSVSPTFQSTLMSNGSSSKCAATKLPDSEIEPDSKQNGTLADAVLGDLDTALESYVTAPRPSPPVSLFSHQPTLQPPSNTTTLNSESRAQSASTSTKISENTPSVFDNGVTTNSLTKEPVNSETSTSSVASCADPDTAQLHVHEKRKGGKAKRKSKPTKVTKYEGSVKTVRRQIKPGHVEELREMFKKQEEENDKLVMRRRRRHLKTQDGGTSDDGDDSGSGYSTTSSDNEYDLELAQRLHSPDCVSVSLLCPHAAPSPSQCEEQSPENTATSRNANTTMLTRTQGDGEDAGLKEDSFVKTASERTLKEADDKSRSIATEKGEKDSEDSLHSPSNVGACGPQFAPTHHRPDSVNTAIPRAFVLSQDLKRHATRTAESTLHTEATTMPPSNAAALETSLSTSENGEAQEQNDVNSVGSLDDSFGKIDSTGYFQSKTETSASFQTVMNSDPSGSSSMSKKKTVAHQVTAGFSGTRHMMDDCHIGHHSSPPLGTAAGSGEEEEEEEHGMRESDSRGGGEGGEQKLTSKVDGEVFSTILLLSKGHDDDDDDGDDDDTNAAMMEGGRGRRRESPDSPAEKEINNTTTFSATTPSHLQVFKSRSKLPTGEEDGRENAAVNQSVAFTSSQTPPLVLSQQMTSPDQVADLPSETHPSSQVDRQQTEETPVDFLSLLDNIHLNTQTTFNAEVAHRAKRLHASDSSDRNRLSAEVSPSKPHVFDSRPSRKEKESSVLKLNKAEDGDAKTSEAGLLAATGVTLFTNDTFTVPPVPTWDESSVRNLEGGRQQETMEDGHQPETPQKDEREVCEPPRAQSWISLSVSTSQKTEGKADVNTSLETNKDSSISEGNMDKPKAVPATIVKDISTLSKNDMTSDELSVDTRDVNTNATSSTTEVEPRLAIQKSEPSLALHVDGSHVQSFPQKEQLEEEPIIIQGGDKHELERQSWDRAFEMDVVAGNIGVKQTSPPVSATAGSSDMMEDESTRILTVGSANEGPSKTSSQVLCKSHPGPSTSDTTSKERRRHLMSPKRQGNSIILSTTRTKSKPKRETSLTNELVSVSRMDLAKGNKTAPTSAMTTVNHVNNFPSKVTVLSSQQAPTTDLTLEPVSERKLPNRRGEQEIKTFYPSTRESAVISSTSVDISVQDNKHEKTSEDCMFKSTQDTRREASRTSGGFHQDISTFSTNLEASQPKTCGGSDVSSRENQERTTQVSVLATLQRNEQDQDLSPRSQKSEKSSHEWSNGDQCSKSTPPDSNDKKSSSKVLVLNTSLHNNTSQDMMFMTHNTSFGDNDSQYGSQTSKATSVGDSSPTDERLYRIVHPDTSLSSTASSTASSILPLNPPPPQHHVVQSSVERDRHVTAECQPGSLNRSQDVIFEQNRSDNGPGVWRTGRLSVSDPDLGHTLFGRSLSIPPQGEEEGRTPEQYRLSEADRSMRRVRSSPSDSDEDSGVEGGMRYRSEVKLALGDTKRRSNSTSSLADVHLSLLPHSATPPPRDYRVSSVQRQASWEKNREGADDESRNVYRVSKMTTADDAPNEPERKSGQWVMKKRQSWSPAENSSQAFKVLHTVPTEKPPLTDDGAFQRKQGTSQQTPPHTAASPEFFDESAPKRTGSVSPPPGTGSPSGTRQHHSIIPPAGNHSDTDTSAIHWARPLFLGGSAADKSNTQREADEVSGAYTGGQTLEESTELGSATADSHSYPQRNQDERGGSPGQASAETRHYSSDDGPDMGPGSKVYSVSTTAHLRQQPPASLQDDIGPDYDNLPYHAEGRHYVVYNNSPQSSAESRTPPRFSEEERITLREMRPTVASPPPEPRPVYDDGAWQARTSDFNSNEVRTMRDDIHVTSPLQQQYHSRDYFTFSSVDNIRDSARDVINVRPFSTEQQQQRSLSQSLFSSEQQPSRVGPPPPPSAPAYPTYSDFHTDHFTTSTLTRGNNEDLYPHHHHHPSGRHILPAAATTVTSTDNDYNYNHAYDDPADTTSGFQREVYEGTTTRNYELRQDTEAIHVMPESDLTTEEEKDLRVLRGKILIQNLLDESRAEEEDFLHNMNVFDTSFHLGKDNPLYQSDPDIYKSLEAELQQQEEEQRKNRAIGQEVTQDVTWETVERVARKHRDEQSPRAAATPLQRQNLSTLLLSKLSSIHSQDIRQTIDVQHRHEDIFGGESALHLAHADGSRAGATHTTSNFDSVHENIELMLKEGKAFVIIHVIAERIVPVDREFDVWRKSQAIVTRNIEIDLHATEQRRRLYQHVMDTGGRVPGARVHDDVTDDAWGDDVGGSWGAAAGDAGGATFRSSRFPSGGGGEAVEERQLSSLETLRLFSQILGVAEEEREGTRVWTGGGGDPGMSGAVGVCRPLLLLPLIPTPPKRWICCTECLKARCFTHWS